MPRLDFSQPATRRAWTRRLQKIRSESDWDAMVRELFAWQYARVPALRRLCQAHDVLPSRFPGWKEIPAVPQQLFKLEKLFAHGSRQPTAIYETSGTTTGQPGRQLLLHSDVYRAASVAGARVAGLLGSAHELHFIAPPPSEAPHSSLSAMFGFWQKSSGVTGQRFWATKEGFDFPGLRKNLEVAIKSKRPVGLSGTAFSFVHLLDAWNEQKPLRLPRGSWLMETGGFKGRSREVAKPDLYAAISRTFGVRDNEIWNEYGMSELSSQAYARGTDGLHRLPPWARVVIWNPATNREAALGERGLVRWFDLANIDSVFALQTLDLAEHTPEGFRLMGRLPRTEARGCSLSAEDLMTGASS